MPHAIFQRSRNLLFSLAGLLALDCNFASADQVPIVVRHPKPMETIVVRLRPGDDVYTSLVKLAEVEQIDAGCVLSCVGSMRKVSLRFANQNETTQLEGKHEIVSLSGTLSRNGSHLHVSVSDSTGKTIGGHLTPGGEVFTTVELVIGVLPELMFQREHDPASGFRELVVRKQNKVAKHSK